MLKFTSWLTLKSKANSNVSSDVFSGIGIWGLDGEPLAIEVNQKVTELLISLNSSSKEFLNLGAIEILAEDGSDIVNTGGVKSALISKPSIKISLIQPIKIAKVILFNRRGPSGLRSRTLELKAYCQSEQVFDFSFFDQVNLSKLEKELLALLRKYKSASKLPKNLYFRQKVIRARVYELLCNNHQASDELLAALLPIDRPLPLLDNYTALYIAKFIEDQLNCGSHPSFKTAALTRFAHLLDSDASIELIVDFTSRYLSKRAGKEVKLSITSQEAKLTDTPQKIESSTDYSKWPWKIKLLRSISSTRDKHANRHCCTHTSLVAWSQCVDGADRPPSNSLSMVKQALEIGFDIIEVDVLTTKDNEVVLAHDDVLENPSGETITVSLSTLEELKRFVIGNYKGSDEYIPSLDQVLNIVENKRLLIDARFKASDYKALKYCIERAGYDPKLLVFCVYNQEQLTELMDNFPNSTHLWKLYTQAWELDDTGLELIARFGVDGIMYTYPYYNEDMTESLFRIRRLGLQSLCFIHGMEWDHPNSIGLSPSLTERTRDNYDQSLKRLVSMGIEYVTTTAINTPTFMDLVERGKFKR